MLTLIIDIMEVRPILKQLGLDGKKADVYLAALELGKATVIEIAKKAGIKRTTSYDILMDLKVAGLVSETIQGKKRLFIGENPEKIQKDLQKKESLFSEILPQLKSIHNISGIKPKIRFYEGKEGLKEVYTDTLNYSGEILMFGSYDVVSILGMDWAKNYLNQRIKKNIYAKAIIPGNELMIQNFISRDQEQRRSTKIIDSKKYPFSIEINIYGHQKIALMSSKDEMGIIIESAEIYKTLKLIFELLWNLLPEIKIK